MFILAYASASGERFGTSLSYILAHYMFFFLVHKSRVCHVACHSIPQIMTMIDPHRTRKKNARVNTRGSRKFCQRGSNFDVFFFFFWGGGGGTAS